MTDTTTIQIQDSTQADLQELKQADGESYDSVLQRLIAGYNNGEQNQIDESDVRNIAERVVERQLEQLR